MGKNKPIIGFILGIIVAVVIFFANIPGLERTGQMCMAFSLMTVIFWACLLYTSPSPRDCS